MIDWLINVAYNIGMFMLLLLFIFGALIHLKYKAEHTPEGANYAMLQELRKLNRLQQEQAQEQLRREEITQIQAEIQSLDLTSQEQRQLQTQLETAIQPPGLMDRINAKLEQWNHSMDERNRRLDEKAAKKKKERLAKKSKTTPATVTPPPLPQQQFQDAEQDAEEEDIKYRKFFDFDSALSWQISGLENIIDGTIKGELPQTKIKAALVALEGQLHANFWEELATLKAELIAEDHHVLLANIEERELEYSEIKQLVEVLLPAELAQAPDSPPGTTPPPLPFLS